MTDRVDSIFEQTQPLTKRANSTERNLKEACENMIARCMPQADHEEAINSTADNFGSVSARVELLTNEFQVLQAHVVHWKVTRTKCVQCARGRRCQACQRSTIHDSLQLMYSAPLRKAIST